MERFMHNRLMMNWRNYGLVGTLALGLMVVGCSKKSGPDQTINPPSPEWTITNHEAGDLSMSEWTMESGNGTSIQVASILPMNAPKDVITKLDSFRQFVKSSAQTLPTLSRYWTTGEYKIDRQYSPISTNDVDTGSVQIIAETTTRAFIVTFRNTKLKQAEFSAYADKTIDDLVKANQK